METLGAFCAASDGVSLMGRYAADGSLDLSNFRQKRWNLVSKRLILFGQTARVRLDLATCRRAGTEISDKIGKRLFQCADELDQDGALSVHSARSRPKAV